MRTRFIAAVVAVQLLVSLVATSLVGQGGGPGRTRVSSPPAAAGTIQSVMPELEAFAERTRGLEFREPVDVTLLDDAAFRRRLLRDNVQDGSDIEKLGKTLRAMGAIDGAVDVAKAVRSLLGAAVVGFYDQKTKKLYVRGVSPTPYVRQVLVHELIHALQDQHFHLDRPELDRADDERAIAFSGLTEGDAVRVDALYRKAMSAGDRAEAEEEEARQARGIDRETPPALLYLLSFPYLYGPKFVDALVAAGGTARIDAAFSDPPVSSEQLIHPAKFLTREDPVKVSEPRADGKVFDHGVLGEAGLFLLLAPAVGGRDAMRAVTGWNGDSYVAWDGDGQSCIRVTVHMTTRAAAAVALTLSNTEIGARREKSDRVVLQKCSGR